MTYKITAALLLAAALTACSGADKTVQSVPSYASAATQDGAAQDVATKTKAVLVYASWCGSCKVLDPKIKAAQALGPVPGLEYVVLDYTKKDADAFYAAAADAGVEEAVRTYMKDGITTGLLLLVDVDDQTVLTKITKKFKAPQIMAALQDAVAKS